jgi:hypothetical protein
VHETPYHIGNTNASGGNVDDISSPLRKPCMDLIMQIDSNLIINPGRACDFQVRGTYDIWKKMVMRRNPLDSEEYSKAHAFLQLIAGITGARYSE